MESTFVFHLSSVAGSDTAQSKGITQPSTGSPFSDLLKEAVTRIQELEHKASSTVEGLISGNGVDIHEAMVATQKASLAFELALAVRNKAVAAYQQLMQMQF